jgi:predicted  nucleic acid-binding Zn-ribbon protein
MHASAQSQQQLIALQGVDIEINALGQRKNNLPEIEQITAVESRQDHCAAELKVVADELEDVTIDLRRAENEVEAVADRLAKDEKRLNAGMGTPKELESIQHEMGSLQKRQAELEEVELEVMVRHEAVSKRLAELQSDEQGLVALKLELSVRLENNRTELDAQIAAKHETRGALAGQIDPALLELYEKVRAQVGLGAAELKGKLCTGCNLDLNAIEVERIKSLPLTEVVRCEECRRILVRG